MATASIALYVTSGNLRPQKNMIVENIDQYLASLSSTWRIASFQYQRIELNKQIKIPASQSYQSYQLYDYLEIFEDDRRFYYFVLSADQTAQNTVTFNLALDTLNTFQGLYTFDDKTTIHRQHKDRWIDSATPLTENTVTKKATVIDKQSEGFGVLPQRLTTRTYINDTSDTRLNQKWYLVYTAQNDNLKSPIKCQLYPKNQFSVKNLSNYSTYISSLQKGYNYYVLYDDNYNGDLNIVFEKLGPDQNVSVSYTLNQSEGTNKRLIGIGYILDNYKNITIAKYIITTPSSADNNAEISIQTLLYAYTDNVSSVKIDTGSSSDGITIRYTPRASSFRFTEDTSHIMTYPTIVPVDAGDALIQNIDTVDKTDSRLQKIIECPYCPINITFDSGGNIILPTGWRLKGLTITLEDTDLSKVDLEHTIMQPTEIDGTALEIYTSHDIPHMAKSMLIEPKLYHSDFSTFKLNYDSFNNGINRENITNFDKDKGTKLQVRYKQSNAMSSSLAFKNIYTFGSYQNDGDYDEYMVCRRNNEIPIYNSEYINYIRTGYNYDVKAKNQQLVSSIVGTAIQGASAAAGFIFSTNPVSAAAGISFASSALSSITSTINAYVAAERSIDQKLNQYRAQSVGVAGSDDLDLLNYYNGNKLVTLQYNVSDKIKKKLFDLFYYCGYADDVQGIPNTSSRYWFNYLQCDAVINSENVYGEFLDDIVARYAIGVTIYHNRNGEYNFDQTYENFETGLVPA